MIERHWKGLAKTDRAMDYIAHLKNETFPKLGKIDGFVRASILNREVPGGVEFLIVTVWRSREAIRKFAGDQLEVAVVPEHAQAMMVDYDRHVSHYEVQFEI